MKLKNIEKICKKTASIYKTQSENNVFVGSASGRFLISDRYADFTTEDFLNLFGISQKTADKWYCEENEATSEEMAIFKDFFKNEKEVFITDYEFSYDGITFKVFKDNKGKIYCAPSFYLLQYKNDDDELSFTVRNEKYLAVKRGMYLDGVIGLMNKTVHKFFGEKFVEMLKGLIEVVEEGMEDGE